MSWTDGDVRAGGCALEAQGDGEEVVLACLDERFDEEERGAESETEGEELVERVWRAPLVSAREASFLDFRTLVGRRCDTTFLCSFCYVSYSLYFCWLNCM